MDLTLGFEALVAVFFATMVLVLKPGPYVLSISSLAASGHWRKVISFLCGSWMGGTFIYFLLLTGLSFVTRFDLGFLFFLLKSLAAAWFIWLGVKGFMHADYTDNAIQEREERFTRKNFFENAIAGFILTASNPYDILFVTGVIPALVRQETFTILDILAIRGTVILADSLTLMLYILPVIYLRQKMQNVRVDILRYIASGFMIAIGLYIGYTAIMADDLLRSGLLG